MFREFGTNDRDKNHVIDTQNNFEERKGKQTYQTLSGKNALEIYHAGCKTKDKLTKPERNKAVQ